MPKQSAEMLSSPSKLKKTLLCLTEKISELDKLLSVVSYSAIGHKFNINESTLYIKSGVFRRSTHKMS